MFNNRSTERYTGTSSNVSHDVDRADRLLQGNFNPFQVSGIFSYFKPKDTSDMLDSLSKSVKGKTGSERCQAQLDWLRDMEIDASESVK